MVQSAIILIFLSIMSADIMIITAQQQCAYNNGNYALNWNVDQQQMIHFNLSITQFGSNRWTAIGFGLGMIAGLDVILIKVDNHSQVIITNAHVKGYQPPTNDATNNVIVQQSATSMINGTLRAQFSRPLIPTTNQPYEVDLTKCNQWNFVVDGGMVNSDLTITKHQQTPISERICNVQTNCHSRSALSTIFNRQSTGTISTTTMPANDLIIPYDNLQTSTTSPNDAIIPYYDLQTPAESSTSTIAPMMIATNQMTYRQYPQQTYQFQPYSQQPYVYNNGGNGQLQYPYQSSINQQPAYSNNNYNNGGSLSATIGPYLPYYQLNSAQPYNGNNQQPYYGGATQSYYNNNINQQQLQQQIAQNQQALRDYQDPNCVGTDPYFCADYVQQFITWQTQYNQLSPQAACGPLIASLQYSDHRCCQSVQQIGCSGQSQG